VKPRHREEVLEALLAEHFGAGVLRGLARWHDWGALSGDVAAGAAIAAEAALLLERRGRLDAALFGALLAARPDREAAIRRAADAWGFTRLPGMSRRHAPVAEATVVSLFAPRLEALRRDVRLADVRLDERSVIRGGALQLRCEITSVHPSVLPLWLGAALKRPGVAMLVDDEGANIDVPGQQVITASRRLRIPREAPAGRYALLVDLWYGPAGAPGDSEWVAHLWPVGGITVAVR